MQLNNEEIEKEQLTKYQLLIQLKTLYKITDKLEQRISTLEKVLESHAKCIGEMRSEVGENIQDIQKRVSDRVGKIYNPKTDQYEEIKS